jgi:YD repeat-containing protein
MMRSFPRLVFATVVSCVLLSAANAEVSLKNGNFFVSFKDIAFPGGFQPTIERVYNSKTSFKGIFGYGWGVAYEVYLEIGGDGTVNLHEWGGGADNIFRPPDMSQEEVQQAADQILAVALKQGDISGDQNSADYRNKLLNDATFRRTQWNNYLSKGLLQPRRLPVGAKLVSMSFSYQTLLVTRDGYRRSMDNGNTQFFGKDGKLRQIADQNNHYVLFSYDVPGQITLRDDANHSLVLTENDRKLVVRVESSDHQICTYRYNERDELVTATDADNNTYTYAYDAAGRHNMTRIAYPNHTTMEITYYPIEASENVKSVKDQDGTITSYTYDIDKQHHEHYTVSVSVKDTGEDGTAGKVISTSSYEYFNKAMPDGSEYTARMISTIDGDRTDTTYNTANLPVRIERNGEVTSFAYDDHGHVTHKETPDAITDLTYDPVVNKVTSVYIVNKKDPSDVQESRFSYDGKGNLLKADSNRKTVTLQYDAKGRISELDVSNGQAITFNYNAQSKPVTIGLVLNGKPSASIDVTYNDDGSIKNVDSDKGRPTALAVTAAFQELLDIIRPAGVTLNF